MESSFNFQGLLNSVVSFSVFLAPSSYRLFHIFSLVTKLEKISCPEVIKTISCSTQHEFCPLKC